MQHTLTFDPAAHEYRLDGFVIPSVTQVMEPLSRAKYGTVDEEVLRAAATRGSEVHEAIEFLVRYGIKECSNVAEPYVRAYEAWAEKAKPQIIHVEQPTWHTSLMYAGTVDMLAVIDGMTTLVDVKTTAQLNDMLTTVQLEAYARALSTQGVQVEQKAILHLRKDGTYRFKKYPPHDVQAWQTFGALLTVRAHIKKYGG